MPPLPFHMKHLRDPQSPSCNNALGCTKFLTWASLQRLCSDPVIVLSWSERGASYLRYRLESTNSTGLSSDGPKEPSRGTGCMASALTGVLSSSCPCWHLYLPSVPWSKRSCSSLATARARTPEPKMRLSFAAWPSRTRKAQQGSKRSAEPNMWAACTTVSCSDQHC